MSTVVPDDVICRAQGALLGQAAGDALGTTVEFMSPKAIAAKYPSGVRDLIGGGPFDLLPGEITDDTELALALARSLVNSGRYDDDEVAAAYRAWYRSGPFDVGGTTRQAFGCSEPAGHGLVKQMRERASPSSQANGSLMRQSPLGVFGWNLDPNALADLACRDSALSHPHPACQEACVAYTHAIALAIRTGAQAGDVYAGTMAFMRDREAAHESGVVSALGRAASEPPEFMRQMGWVLIALQNGFHRLLHASSLEEGIVQTVHAGGDTDTNACIIGALLGAVHGAKRLPERWRRILLACRTERPHVYWCGDLPELAESLCRLGAGAGGIPA